MHTGGYAGPVPSPLGRWAAAAGGWWAAAAADGGRWAAAGRCAVCCHWQCVLCAVCCVLRALCVCMVVCGVRSRCAVCGCYIGQSHALLHIGYCGSGVAEAKDVAVVAAAAAAEAASASANHNAQLVHRPIETHSQCIGCTAVPMLWQALYQLRAVYLQISSLLEQAPCRDLEWHGNRLL